LFRSSVWRLQWRCRPEESGGGLAVSGSSQSVSCFGLTMMVPLRMHGALHLIMARKPGL
jgi:hypothetical protein